MSVSLNFSRVFFSYESAAGPLFEDFSLSFPPGWTGVVGANGAGKSTLLRLAAGRLAPGGGRIDRIGRCCFCIQEVDCPPPEAAGLFASYEDDAQRLRRELSLAPEMPERWDFLSMGERKKLQIGAALFGQPDILCLDEPTNHLDAAGREALARSLREFRGIGLLVSHDRELLDLLCGQCLFLRPGRFSLRPGGVTAGRAAEALAVRQSQAAAQQLKAELRRSKQELQRRREKEQRAENRNSKRQVGKKDFDAKGRIDAARVSGRSGRAAELAGRQAKAVARNAAALEGHEYLKTPEYGLRIPYGSDSRRNLLLELPAGSIPVGSRCLRLPELAVGATDRIALTGDNGSGKSTLLRHLAAAWKLPAEKILYLPQELPEELKKEICHTLGTLGRGDYSRVMSIVASLGSAPERVLNSDRCSPGEWRKLFFGLGVLREVNLIIMDEPTNHLDLPSIECLEAALRDCAGALLLVSHDRTFLRRSCRLRWHIVRDAAENRLERSYSDVTETSSM